MWNWVRYFGVEYVKTLMDSSQTSASENKLFSSSVSSGTDALNSSEGVTYKAQFRSSEPITVSVVLAKKKILKVLEESSADASKVSFSIREVASLASIRIAPPLRSSCELSHFWRRSAGKVKEFAIWRLLNHVQRLKSWKSSSR